MPTVFIPTMLKELTGGAAEVEVSGATVRQVLDSLESRWPGMASRLLDDEGRLRANLAVAIDGEISTLGLRENVEPDSEIHFVSAIAGGRGSAPQ